MQRDIPEISDLNHQLVASQAEVTAGPAAGASTAALNLVLLPAAETCSGDGHAGLRPQPARLPWSGWLQMQAACTVVSAAESTSNHRESQGC